MIWSDREFELLFRALYPRVLRSAHLMLGDRASAEDVAQEAFARLLARGALPPEDAERWVFKVGRNLAISRIRAVTRLPSSLWIWTSRTLPPSGSIFATSSLIRRSETGIVAATSVPSKSGKPACRCRSKSAEIAGSMNAKLAHCCTMFLRVLNFIDPRAKT